VGVRGQLPLLIMIKGQDMYFAPPPIKIQEKNTFYLNKYAINKNTDNHNQEHDMLNV